MTRAPKISFSHVVTFFCLRAKPYQSKAKCPPALSPRGFVQAKDLDDLPADQVASLEFDQHPGYTGIAPVHGQGLPTAPSAGTCAGAAAVAAVAGAALAAHAADTAQQGGGGLANAVQDSAAAAAAAAVTAAVGAQQEGVELAFTDEDQEALKAVAAATGLTQKKREDTSEWFLRAREVALQNQVCARAIQCR